MTTPADPFAVIRTRQYVVLLAFAGALGVVVSTGAYWFLKLVADIQGGVYTDLPKGLGFHGTPPLSRHDHQPVHLVSHHGHSCPCSR